MTPGLFILFRVSSLYKRKPIFFSIFSCFSRPVSCLKSSSRGRLQTFEVSNVFHKVIQRDYVEQHGKRCLEKCSPAAKKTKTHVHFFASGEKMPHTFVRLWQIKGAEQKRDVCAQFRRITLLPGNQRFCSCFYTVDPFANGFSQETTCARICFVRVGLLTTARVCYKTSRLMKTTRRPFGTAYPIHR